MVLGEQFVWGLSFQYQIVYLQHLRYLFICRIAEGLEMFEQGLVKNGWACVDSEWYTTESIVLDVITNRRFREVIHP